MYKDNVAFIITNIIINLYQQIYYIFFPKNETTLFLLFIYTIDIDYRSYLYYYIFYFYSVDIIVGTRSLSLLLPSDNNPWKRYIKKFSSTHIHTWIFLPLLPLQSLSSNQIRNCRVTYAPKSGKAGVHKHGFKSSIVKSNGRQMHQPSVIRVGRRCTCVQGDKYF